MSSPLEKLLEDMKPTVHQIIKESGTIIPDFLERRLADKHIRSTIITMIARYGPQVSIGLDSILPLAKNMFKEEYYEKLVLLKELADTPTGELGSLAAVNARLDNNLNFTQITK